jgi:Tetratricopeptide repeat
MINWIAAKALHGQIDFGIIVTSVSEQEVILKHFPPQGFIKGRQHYVLSSVPRNDQECYRVAILRVPESYVLRNYLPIQESISWGIKNFVADLAPTWLINPTVARVFAHQMPLEDVIIGTHVIDLTDVQSVTAEDLRAKSKALVTANYLTGSPNNTPQIANWSLQLPGLTTAASKTAKTAKKSPKAAKDDKTDKTTKANKDSKEASVAIKHCHFWPILTTRTDFVDTIVPQLVAEGPLPYTEFSDLFFQIAAQHDTPLLLIAGVECCLTQAEELDNCYEGENDPYLEGLKHAAVFLHALLKETTPLPLRPPLQITEAMLIDFPDEEEVIARNHLDDSLPTYESEMAEKLKIAKSTKADDDDDDEDDDDIDADDEEFDDSETDSADFDPDADDEDFDEEDETDDEDDEDDDEDEDEDDTDEDDEDGDEDDSTEELLKREQRTYLNDPLIAFYAEFVDTIGAIYGEKSLEYVDVMVRKARLLFCNGLVLNSENALEIAMEIVLELVGKKHLDYAKVLDGFAEVFNLKKDFRMANEVAQKALALRRDLLGPEHPDTIATVRHLADIAFNKQDLRRAEDLIKKSLALFEKNNLTTHPEYPLALFRLYSVYLAAEKPAKAEKYLLSALPIWRKMPEFQRCAYIRALQDLAKFYFENDQTEKALPLLQEGLRATYSHSQGIRHPFYVVFVGSLTRVYSLQKRHAEVEAIYSESLAAIEKEFTSHSVYYTLCLNKLGRLRLVNGDYAQAKAAYQQSAELVAQTYGKDSQGYTRQLLLLTWVDLQAQAYDKAEAHCLELCRIIEAAHDSVGTQSKDLADSSLPSSLDPLFLLVAKQLIQIYELTNQAEELHSWQQKYLIAKKIFTHVDLTVPELLNWAMSYTEDEQHHIRTFILREAMLITFQSEPFPDDDDINTVLNLYIQSMLENNELQPDEINSRVPTILDELLTEAGIKDSVLATPPNSPKKRRR